MHYGVLEVSPKKNSYRSYRVHLKDGMLSCYRLKKRRGGKVHLKPDPTVVNIELISVENTEDDKEEGPVVSDIQGSVLSTSSLSY